jgi:hypothetical protein
MVQMSARERAKRRRAPEPVAEVPEAPPPRLENAAAPPPMQSPAPGIGHNLPPAKLGDDAERWSEWMAHVFAGCLARRAQFEAPFARFLEKYKLLADPNGGPPIGIEAWDDDVAGRAGDFRDKIAALIKLADDLHSIEKAPILVAQKAVDGFLKAFLAPLETTDTKGKRLRGGSGMLNVLGDRLTIYLNWKAEEGRREATRIAAEELEKAQALARQAIESDDPDKLEQAATAAAAADAAASVATAPNRELARTHGALGSVSTLRDNWTWEKGDLMELVRAVAAGKEKLEYLTFNETRISFAVRSEKVRAIAGVTIRNDQRA